MPEGLCVSGSVVPDGSGDGRGPEGNDRPVLVRVVTYVAGIGLLGVAAWLGEMVGAMLALPLITAAVVAVAQPEIVVRWSERLEAWVKAKHLDLQTEQRRVSRWLLRGYVGGLRRIAIWTVTIDNRFTRSGIRIASDLYFSFFFFAILYLAAIVFLAIIAVVIVIVVGIWILSKYAFRDRGSVGGQYGPIAMRFRKGEKFTVRQRESGLFESIFGGSRTTREIVAENGKIVATIQREDPGLLSALTGESAKEVIRTREGTKVATFDREASGLISSLMGENPKTVLTAADGEKIAELGRAEPGLIGSLLGEGSRTIIRGPDGQELAEVGVEQPGILGSLADEKSKRVVKVTRDSSDD